MTEYSSIRQGIQDLYGEQVHIKSEQAISGGDINRACCLVLSDGTRVFVKSNRRKSVEFFRAEYEGLESIRRLGVIGTPKVKGMGTDRSEGAFLIMEYINAGRKRKDYWEVFGEELAKMHRQDPSRFVSGGCYGFIKDNYIGSREQINTPYDAWIPFFRDCRLIPRFTAAGEYFDREWRRKIDYLLSHLENWLIEPESSSLIHGDLWSGNAIVGSDGKAWLIDPAVYVGHPEADIAMTELFGGFDYRFYESYRNVLPFEAGYDDRRDIYNLYHLLNHLISFGSGYYGSVCRVIDRFAS